LQISPKFKFEDEGPTKMPLLGRIAAGSPIEAIEDREVLDIEEIFKSPVETFVLRVKGDSMIDDHICDGDYVICERRTSPRNGETVVAIVDDGEATLKRFYRDGSRIRLQPANPAYEPIYPAELDIRGVAIGVIRQL